VGQFVYVIRKRIKLSPEKAIFIPEKGSQFDMTQPGIQGKMHLFQKVPRLEQDHPGATR
jgi:hypothetical protein